jgi:hypothetical protein
MLDGPPIDPMETPSVKPGAGLSVMVMGSVVWFGCGVGKLLRVTPKSEQGADGLDGSAAMSSEYAGRPLAVVLRPPGWVALKLIFATLKR